jgi:APA family basic amino acid/polyamine antiporter
LHGARIYVGLLAATILFIATNAGVIGASRITYSMASYRQLPEVFRRLHPKLKTPWLSLVIFAGLASILFLLPGNVDFIGRMYSFGAMLSFTIAHAAVVQLRRQHRVEEAFRAWPNLRVSGVDWPLFALLGGLGTGIAWLVVVYKDAPTRYAGLGWLAVGFAFYVGFRRRVLHAPLTQTIRAPIPIGPALALEYRNILVPVVDAEESEEAVDLAARLAAERGASIVALAVVEVPLELPLDARMEEEEERANDVLDEAKAIGDLYGVTVIGRLARARSAGRAIVDEATRRGSEIIVLGTPRGRPRARPAIFGETVDYVLKHAPCRVMIAAAPAPAPLAA